MALPPSTEINELTFVVKKKYTMMLSRVLFFREQARKLKIKCRPRSRIKSTLITHILRRQKRCAGRE